MANVSIVLSTFPDRGTAREVATQIVTQRLAACANLLGPIDSIYRWKENVESAAEILVLFKLATERYADFESKLKSLHPYDVPEIVALDVTNGLPSYLAWAVECSSDAIRQ